MTLKMTRVPPSTHNRFECRSRGTHHRSLQASWPGRGLPAEFFLKNRFGKTTTPNAQGRATFWQSLRPQVASWVRIRGVGGVFPRYYALERSLPGCTAEECFWLLPTLLRPRKATSRSPVEGSGVSYPKAAGETYVKNTCFRSKDGGVFVAPSLPATSAKRGRVLSTVPSCKDSSRAQVATQAWGLAVLLAMSGGTTFSSTRGGGW
mmetsp:Transcript_23553/g.53739  ORF Transcript_23553/g.53739 Transcript_23553/m.53739 type:complete len:206 (+) Transcript_23553:803-1420(+)